MIERQIICKILASRDIEWLIDKPYFCDYKLWEPLKDEYKFIYDHYCKYGEVVDMATFLDKFEEFEKVEVTESNESLLDKMDEETHYKLTMPRLNKINDLTDDSYAAMDYIASLSETSIAYRNKLFAPNYSIGKIVSDFMSNLTDADYRKISTGFPELDNEIDGGFLCTKEVVAVLAQSGAGKTWTLLKMALAACESGKKVGLVSAEMDGTECAERMCTIKYKLNYNEVTSRKHDDKLVELAKQFSDNLIILDPVSWQNRDTAYLKMFAKQNKLDAFYIDGGQYVETVDKEEDKDWARLMKMQREIYQISCELKIPIIITFQCNRTGAKESRSSRKPPLPENIGESSKIIEACTKVLSIGRYGDEFKIGVTKSRKTKEGAIFVYNWDVVNGDYRFLRAETYDDDITVDEAKRLNDVSRMTQQSMEATKRMRKGVIRPGKDRFL